HRRQWQWPSIRRQPAKWRRADQYGAPHPFAGWQYPLGIGPRARHPGHHFITHSNRRNMNLTIGIADDHQLFLRSLSLLVGSFPGVEVTLEALHGEDLLRKLALTPRTPDILLIDVNMPVMDGAKAAQKISRDYPAIRLV